MENGSEFECFSLLRSRAMRIGALVVSAYLLLLAINAIIEPLLYRHRKFTFLQSGVFPWIPGWVVLVLNFALNAYLVWLFITLIRASRCLEERLISGAFAASFAIGFLTDLSSRTPTVIVRYGDLAIWAIATAAAARLFVRYRNESDSEPVQQAVTERRFVETVALYFGETFVATAGAMLAVGIALRQFYPTEHVMLPNLTKESFTALNYLPYSPLQIGAGFALGYLTALYFRSRTVLLVWIAPMAVVILYLCTYQPESVFENRWITALTRLFGSTSCRPPDCYDRLFIAPLYAAVAFSLGSWLRLKKQRAST